MNFNDVKLLLPASGYMKTSDDGGRTVIDEIRDASYERNHQTFIGSDRPELTTYRDFPSVDVEKESTNFVLDSRDMTTANWNGSAIVSRDEPGFDGSANGACTIEDSSVAESTYRRQSVTVPDNNDVYTATFFIKKDNDESRFPMVLHQLSGGSNPIFQYTQINTKTGATSDEASDGTVNVIDHTDFWEVELTITNNASGNTTDRIAAYPARGSTLGVADNSVTGSTVFDQVQLEQSSYPTNPIITQGTPVTRLAPLPVIQNALPETGTVAGVVDMVRDNSVNQDIFVTTGDAGTDLSRLRLNTSNQFELQIFGSTGGSITQANPFTGWGNNERLDLQIGVNYDATNLYLFLSDGTNTYFYTVAHDINSSTNKDFTFGNNHSMRLATTYKDEISRTTQSEFETLFSLI